MGLKILHLSDLHLGEEDQIFKNADEFAAQVAKVTEENAPDVILVSGDVFNAKQFSEDDYFGLIVKAKQYFDALLNKINQKSDHEIRKEDILFVPGNHEVYIPNAEVGKDVFSRYGEFLDAFYERNKAEVLCWGTLLVFPAI